MFVRVFVDIVVDDELASADEDTRRTGRDRRLRKVAVEAAVDVAEMKMQDMKNHE